MLLLTCPYCGPRAEVEFRYAGEAHIVRPAPAASEELWSAYLYFRNNARGEHAERWCHIQGCGQFFNAVRNTATDHIIQIYRKDAERPAAGAEI